MKNEVYFRHVVLQPTTLCNLNCRYCYLTDRKIKGYMPPAVPKAVAKSIEDLGYPVSIVWHGGEPLVTGVQRFKKLLAPFESLRKQGKVSHSIQTNGTLITQEWCELFKAEGFNVGVSLDGDQIQNSARVDWAGRESYFDVIKGIELLKVNQIPFGIISVVNPNNLDNPARFYEFMSSLGCHTLNVNIEEREGLNQSAEDIDGQAVKRFWSALFQAWRNNPAIKIREFDMALGWMKSVIATDNPHVPSYSRNLWPTIAINGDVVVLSPEFISVDLAERYKFVVGNVLFTPLTEVVKQSKDAWYVQEFRKGVDECRSICPYYEFCGGGQASNKYFELGNIAGTETAQCRNTRQSVIDVLLDAVV